MLKDSIANHPVVHSREIRLSTFPHDADSIIVRGELLDTRHVPIVDVLGRAKSPGTVHHICVYLLVESGPLRIVRAEAEMHAVPSDQCRETLDVLEKVAGLEIRPGFSRNVRSLVGGTEGCTHLCTLVKAMGTEIVHGWMTRTRNRSPDRSIPPDAQKDYLVDSCRLWKKDGPKYREMAAAIQSRDTE